MELASEDRKNKKKTWSWIVFIVLVLVIGLLVYVKSVNSKDLTANDFKVIQVEKESIKSNLTVSGVINPKEEQKVFPSGEISNIKQVIVEEGDPVKKGDALISYSNREVDFQLEQANISKKRTLIQLERLNNQKKHLLEELETTRTQIKENKSKDQSELNSSLKKELEGYQEQYEEVKFQIRETNLTFKENTLLIDKLEHTKTEESTLLAKITGNINDINMNPSPMNEVASPIIHITSKENIVKGTVSEFDVQKVKKGQKVKIYSKSTDTTFKGVVSQVVSSGSKAIEENIAKYPIEITFNKQPKLPVDSHVNAEIELEERYTLTIPYEAILKQEDEEFVFVKNKGVLNKVKVETGSIYKERVEIVKGLDEGTKVIKKSDQVMYEGMEVPSID